MRTSSPARTRVLPYVCATRLMASVVPRTKMISSARAALMNRLTFSRAPSYSFVARAQGRERKQVHHLAGEGVGEQAPRRLAPEAARPQVEERVLVELTDGGAVRALHVVGEDLQLRLGIDDRALGNDQVLVDLAGI